MNGSEMKVQLLLGSAAGAAVAMANEDPSTAQSSPRALQLEHGIRERFASTSAASSFQNRHLLEISRARPSTDARNQNSSATTASITPMTATKAAKTDQDIPEGDAAAGKTGKVTGTSSGGKTGKGGSSGGKSGKSSQDAYYMGPLSCPNQCVDASGVDFLSGLLTNVIRRCDNESIDQKWQVHNDETFLKIESMAYPDLCIAISDRSSCGGGVLALGNCADHESMWYFTGGQLISAYCWVNGFTNVMGVIPNAGGNCSPSLNGFPGADYYVIRADFFLFIDENSIMGNVPTQEPTYPYYLPTASPTYMPSYIPTKSPTK
ncbi:hypothetical protein ACHAW6_010123 [Cyclotella cf. meneghiniana]